MRSPGTVTTPSDPAGEDAEAGRQAQQFALLQASVARLNDIVVITEAEASGSVGARIVFVNDAFERIIGHRREDALGRSPDFLWGPLTERTELERLHAALVAGKSARSELAHYTRSGEIVWFEVDLAPLFDADDRYTHCVAVLRDVTERRQARQILHESEQRFQRIARATSDTLWDWNLLTDHIWWGEGLQNTFGHVPDTLPAGSRSWTDLIHPLDRERVIQGIRQVIDGGGEHWTAEYRLRRADGRYAYVLDRGAVIHDEAGRPARVVGGMTDLTHRNEAELELARLNRALRLRGACNEAVVRARDEAGLLDAACHIMVEIGGYRMTWVGLVEDAHRLVIEQTACAGPGPHAPRNLLPHTAHPAAIDEGALGRAVRDRRIVIVENLHSEPGFAPWLDAAEESGCRSVIVLPISDTRRTYGVFALFAPDPAQADIDEMELLQQLAGDLAFAIATLRNRREQNRIQATVLKIAAGVSVSSGAAFFEELVANMTEALGADAGCIARFVPGEPPTARTEIAYVDGRLAPNFEYSLAGTPCEHLRCAASHVIASGVAETHACGAVFGMSPPQAYVGHRLEDSAGQPIGQLFVLFARPLEDAALVTSTLQIFASRVAAEMERQASDARIRQQASLLDKAQDAIIVRGLDHTIRYWNKGAERLYGWRSDEVIGRSTEALLYTDAAAFHENTREVLRHGEWSGELAQQRKDGSTRIVEAHWTLVRDEQQRPDAILAINTDITERKAAEREIEQLAFYDPLTGLPNRQLLRDRLQHALAIEARSARVGALLFIDIDDFKTLNDTLGHAFGDLLLQQIAQRLHACLREGDTLARLGGDEFVIVLENLADHRQEAAAAATAVGDKLLASFLAPFRLAECVHHSSASLGVTLFNDQPASVDELLKRADLAMYQAKAAGRNMLHFFDPEMQAVVSARAELESELRDALQRDAFELHYQAQVDDLGRICGVEALLRWPHPARGWVAPNSFIPLAEETGLILPLGQRVLDMACAQLVEWATLPHMAALKLALNVSARQFRQPDFVEQVLRSVERSGADPQRLKFELTESLMVADLGEITARMEALKACGIGFSLDDFGTGYSSLAYLKRLPLDEIKIDQSFVRDVLTDANDASIARSILAMGQSLNLTVVAEGVETASQHAFLAEHGCHAYQGYLFNRPQPAAIFEAWVQSQYGALAVHGRAVADDAP